MHTLKNNAGYTLMELLVVVVIIAILVGIGIISGRAQIGKARIEQQTRQLYADILSARAGAMNRSRNHFVVVNAALRRYEIWEDTSPAPFGDEDQTAADTRLAQITSEDQLTITLGFGLTTIEFDTRGLTAVNGNIRIGDGSFNPRVDCVTISATRVRVGRFEGGNCVS